jgi:hypothetical protein
MKTVKLALLTSRWLDRQAAKKKAHNCVLLSLRKVRMEEWQIGDCLTRWLQYRRSKGAKTAKC